MDDKIHAPIPSAPKCRKPIRPDLPRDYYYLNNNSHRLSMESKTSRQQKSYSSENETSSDDINHDKMTESSNEQGQKNEKKSPQLRNRSRTISPEKSNVPQKTSSKIEQNTNSSFHKSFATLGYIAIILIILMLLYLTMNEKQTHLKQTNTLNNPNSLLFESIKSVKAKFHNQESNIWYDIASAINEVISRNPKIPSIVLLFANETSTMDCLATDLARASSTVLHTDSPLYLNPENFGDDAGEVINTLNEHSPAKKVVVIRDILNINTEAIKALHNLCDRINPLIGEAIYILTMQTNDYQSSQKKLAFVEKQIYHKLSKNIDQDILMALVTRITDGAIISVQPEPNLRYC